MNMVQGFNSFEEMQEFMRKQTEGANERLAEEQKTITWGSHWVRFLDLDGSLLLICGYVDTLEEYLQKERDAGADEEEVEYAKATLPENHARGYMSGTAYSVIEPEGELGDTHRYNAWPISKELFEKVREAGWQLGQMDDAGVHELAAIHKRWSAHQREHGI